MSENENAKPASTTATVIDFNKWVFDKRRTGQLSVARQCQLLERAFAERRRENLVTLSALAAAVQAQEERR